MWQGYVYVNDVRYSNIFTFAVGIFFVNASQMKTPLESEPLRFGQQWCFCHKLCIYAGSRAIGFQIQTGH